MSTSTSSSDSDSSSGDEGAAMLVDDGAIDRLEAKVRANPYDFNVHLEYINALRKMGDLTRLRNAREDLAQRFPLSEGEGVQQTHSDAR